MDLPSPAAPALAAVLADRLRACGVRRIFGIPGGGSSLAVIEAADRAGIEFVLARGETAAAIMAAVTGELTGTPGVVLTGVGPGAASVVNGIAYAHLEKAPLLLLTDGPASSPHQAFDQNALFRPVTKLQGRLRPESGVAELDAALAAAMTRPWGPVQLDMSAGDAVAPVTPEGGSPAPAPVSSPTIMEGDIEVARHLLAASRRPVVIAGLEARYDGAPAALRRMAEALGCPVLLTYKAKGVLPDAHPAHAGLFTGAAAEAETIAAGDLIVLFGLDAIEMIPAAWPYESPILELTPAAATPLPAIPACRITGPLAETAAELLSGAPRSEWTSSRIRELRGATRARLALRGRGHTAQSVTEALRAVAPAGCRLAVDAGAHMFAALELWRAEEPFGVLKSNGLSTMGYALPAAIASALEEPERPVAVVTGDGGLAMCLAELATAAERNCPITVAVINDAALSLIDIKQQRQQYRSRGVRTASLDFAGCARALATRAWRVEPGGALEPVLRQAFAGPGPVLVDIVCDPAGYGDQLVALRG